jgi:hypothetical protein
MTVTADNPVDLAMPPMNVVKCQCLQNICPMSGPCPLEATDDDMLCDPCREYERHVRNLKEGVYSASLVDTIRFLRKAGAALSHCHKCDPEYYSKGDDDGDWSRSA